MKHRKLIQCATCFLSLLLLYCARNKGNPVGTAYFERDNMGAENRVVYQPVSKDTSFKTYVNTAGSPYLFLGDIPDITSRILLHFAALPDSGVVDSARITLHTESLIGERTGAFTATVHPVLAEWNAATVTWESFTDDMIGDAIVEVDFSADDIDVAGDSLAYTFDLPLDLVQSWVDSTTAAENYGIVICAPPSDFLVSLHSDDNAVSTGLSPELYLRYTTDTVRTYSYTPSSDLFLADSGREPGENSLYIGNGAGFHSVVRIEVDTIPENATINRAQLRFMVDSLLSFPNHSDLFAASIFPVLDEPWTIPEVAVDSTVAYSAGVYGDTLVFSLTSLVQGWATGLLENHGVLLVGNSELYNVNRRVLRDMSSDPALRPRMEIHYSLPPSSKF